MAIDAAALAAITAAVSVRGNDYLVGVAGDVRKASPYVSNATVCPVP